MRFMRPMALCAVLAAVALVPTQASELHMLSAPQRLSQWLEQRAALADPLGLVWTTPEALAEQRLAHQRLREAIDRAQQQEQLSVAAGDRLRQWLLALPPVGRVRLPAVDAAWLAANPRRDPVLQAGDSLRIHGPGRVVRLLTDEGQVCEVPHRHGLRAADYARACVADSQPHAWVVQPDGRVQAVGLDMWNAGLQDEPAPGAWIWLARQARLPQAFHEQWAQWLAWQGPSQTWPTGAVPEAMQGAAPQPHRAGWLDLTGQGLEPEVTSSDWGPVGLLQTPSARMRPAGSLGLRMHRVSPYRQLSLMLQPLPWLETGFRYVSIENRAYGPASYSGDQDYKDKSIDLKLRLLEEGRYRPALALGWRDMGGTGLFSGEYLVASKRWGRFDASLGLGWGYLGNRGSIGNPLSALGGRRFDTRKVAGGEGGTFATESWFRGPTSLFGGLEYQSPWKLHIKLEYDPGRYQNEPLGNRFAVGSPVNWGVVYRPSRGSELSLGVNRGNRLTFGWTLHTDLSGLSMPKLSDPPLPQARTTPASVPTAWPVLAREIERHTQWEVTQILDAKDRLTVQAQQSSSPAPQERLDKAVAVMHVHLPQRYQFLHVEHQLAGQTLVTQTVDRQSWVRKQTQPARSAAGENASSISHEQRLPGEPMLDPTPLRAWLQPGLDLTQTLGGPDGFFLYQLSLALRGRLSLSDGTELKGQLRQRLVNNYDKFRDGGHSRLPRVRTHLREYYVSSGTTLSNLSLSRTARLGEDVYLAAYGGLFEEMFAGVGAELLYRWPGRRVAFGLDLNHVQQRDFRQDLRLRDYRTGTGHLTGYWVTPWHGIEASLAVGQYLAGDRGATLTLARTFGNGARMGAFATKTNVPAALFGEGSFDKGLFWSIPLDAMLTRSSRSHTHFGWKPLTRDGGAMVTRPVQLYQETQWLHPDAHNRRSAPPPPDRVAPDDRIDTPLRRP